ncbi:MAG: CHAT domain-containing protein [Planctomycetota bacterium]|nr:CHAT domain-containing protein [Planctomycetota bacterium]
MERGAQQSESIAQLVESFHAPGADRTNIYYALWDALELGTETLVLLELYELLLPELLPTDDLVFHFCLVEMGMGMAYRKERRWDAALLHFYQAEARLAGSEKRKYLLSNLLGERAETYLRMGLHGLGYDSWQDQVEAVALLAGTREQGPAQQWAHLVETHILMAREDVDELEARVTEILENETLYPLGSAKRGVLLSRVGFTRLDRSRIDFESISSAEEFLYRALDSELSTDERVHVLLSLADLELVRGDVGSARESLTLADEFQSVIAAVPDLALTRATLEAHIARVGGDAVEMKAARQGLAKVVEEFLDGWIGTVPRVGGHGFLEFIDHRSAISELIDLEVLLAPGLEGAQRAMDWLLRVQAVNSTGRAFGEMQPGGSGKRPEGSLSELRGELVYFTGPNRSHLFVIEDGDLAHVELAASDTLTIATKDLVRAYLAAAQGGETEAEERLADYDAKLARLAKLVLPGSAADALSRWNEVTFVGADLLGTVPFESMILEGLGVIGEEIAICYTSSLPSTWLMDSRAPVATPGIDVFAFGRPAAEITQRFGALGELPLNLDWHEDLAGAFGALPARFHENELASVEALMGASFAPGSLLHLVAHGVQDFERELPSALVLHGASIEAALLRSEDIAKTFDSPALVVLQACASDMGPQRRGDGAATGFSAAFLRGGASCVVLSPFPSEFHASSRLLSQFYRELVSGHSPAEALRRARKWNSREGHRSARFRDGMLRVVGLGHHAFAMPQAPAPSPSGRAPTFLLFIGIATVLVIGIGRKARRLRRPS